MLEKFELSEKFRAETWRHFGYVLCTPVCAIGLYWILSGLIFFPNFGLSFILSILLFISGVVIIINSYNALLKLDSQRK